MPSQSPRLALCLFLIRQRYTGSAASIPPKDDTGSQADVESMAPVLEPMGLRLSNPESDATDPSKESARDGYRGTRSGFLASKGHGHGKGPTAFSRFPCLDRVRSFL